VEWNDQNEWDPSQNIFHMEWMEVFTVPHVIHLESLGIPGIPPPIPWNPYGMTLAEAPPIFPFHRHHGFQVEWSWNGIFHMESGNIPPGFQGNEAGFHGMVPWDSIE